MKTIIKSFSEHGTFVQPDTLDYIMSKDNPQEFSSFITKNLTEFPLVLTINHIKDIEQLSVVKKTQKTVIDPSPVKEIQTKRLSEIYGGEVQLPSTDDIELEYDDPDIDDQINLSEEASD